MLIRLQATEGRNKILDELERAQPSARPENSRKPSAPVHGKSQGQHPVTLKLILLLVFSWP